MGNKLGRRRQVVDEKYTRPQGLLYQDRDVDHKKLRRLILDSKLAPCYPGDDDSRYDLEECPICFLYYPSLNRSRCCLKGICTECFLQMKTPNSSRPTQCPFCKTSNYAVEYRGIKTKEEKSSEQLEEQRVIEAKIRMRQQEIRDEGERTLKKQGEIEYSDSTIGPAEADHCSTREVIASHEGDTSTRPSPHGRQNREDELDLDLEDIMVMEAIWLSIQETGRCPAHPSPYALRTEECIADDYSPSATMGPVTQPSSPSGGLACAIAALPECHQTMSIETPGSSPSHMPVYSTGPGCSGYSAGREAEDYYPTESGTGGDDDGDWAETSYVGSGEFDDVANPPGSGPHDENRCGPRPTGAPVTPLFHFAARDIFFNRPPT